MIDGVKLHNFISHADTDLRLKPGITVFVGKNGAGKSSVIDGITYALYGKHMRASNESLVKKGASIATATVEFDVSGRRYIVERKLDKKGQLLGSVFKEVSGGGEKQLAAGERKQFGESLSEEVGKVFGLDYDRMRVAAIIQQGELDSIVVDFKPRQFKELVDSLIGIDRLKTAYENMRGAIDDFRSYIRGIHGFDDQGLDVAKKQAASLLGSLEVAREDLAKAKPLYDALKTVESDLERSVAEMEPLREKAGLLRNNVHTLVEYVGRRRTELREELIGLDSIIAKATENLHRVAEEKDTQKEHARAKRIVALLERKILDTTATISKLEPMGKRPRDLLGLVAKARDYLAIIEKHGMAGESVVDHEGQTKRIDAQRLAVGKQIAGLEANLATAERLEFKHNTCPVCGSKVERISPIFDAKELREHIREQTTQATKLESLKNNLDSALRKLRQQASEVKEARAFLSEQGIRREADVAKLKRERSKLDAQLSKLPRLKAELAFEKKTKGVQEGKESELAEKLKAISLAKAYLEEHKLSTLKDVTRLSRERIQRAATLDGLPIDLESMKEATVASDLRTLDIDEHSKSLLVQIRRLSEEASMFDEKVYEAKSKSLDEYRSIKVRDQFAKVEVLRNNIAKEEKDLKALTEKVMRVQKAADFLAILSRVREMVYHRDGPVSSSFRSWALKHIGAKASEYAGLFGIGVSNVRLKEDGREITIECYGPKGTMEIASMSGGEKVAVALAIRFGMAYVMGGYKLDFVILDEPTVHLDEERKASMVDIISNLAIESSPLKQVIIITHDSEIFENADVDSVYKFEATPEGTKVTLQDEGHRASDSDLATPIATSAQEGTRFSTAA